MLGQSANDVGDHDIGWEALGPGSSMNLAVLGFGVLLGVTALLLETLLGHWGAGFARGQALLELLTFPAFLLVVLGLAMERRPGAGVDTIAPGAPPR